MADLPGFPIAAKTGPVGHVIPMHRAHRQRDATSYVGIIVFVASWVMMFAALFMSYTVLRIRTPVWPPVGFARLPLGLPLVATCVLALSSAVLQRGLSLAQKGALETYLGYLLGTIVLGLGFIALQCTVWWTLWQGGLQLTSGIYGAMFYLLTCFHALHVLVGLGFLSSLVPSAIGGRGLASKVGRLGVITIYWHFVGVVWGVMFVLVYLA